MVNGTVLACLLNSGDGSTQRRLGFFQRAFSYRGPDVLNHVLHPSAVSLVAKIPLVVLSGPFDGRFVCCQNRLLLSELPSNFRASDWRDALEPCQLLGLSGRLVKPYFLPYAEPSGSRENSLDAPGGSTGLFNPDRGHA